MIDRTTKLRWRRRVRRRKRQVEDIGSQAEEHLDRHLFRRLVKLPNVLRFAASWTVLFLLLISLSVIQSRALDNHYLIEKPAPGGIFTEGIFGTYTNANPIYTAGVVDNSVSSLVFAGLLKVNQDNKLEPDLATTWSVDNSERIYTVKLRENLTWHDGRPLTSQDALFTFQTIQNPDAKSPLFTGWQGIRVEAPDPLTVKFTLPNGLAAFPYSLTTGLLPKHILGGEAPEQLRSLNFNSASPIGAGPFKFTGLEVSGQSVETREVQIAFEPFENYALGRPKLSKFIIRAFYNESRLLKSFENNELNGAAGLSSAPAELTAKLSVREFNIPLFSEVLVFFKTTSPALKDVKVRQALVMATNTKEAIDVLGYPVAVANSPLLKAQVGYDKRLVQLKTDVNKAQKTLTDAGWAIGADGIRAKGGQRLSFNLTTQDDDGYKAIADVLKNQWQAIGVELQVVTTTAAELQPNLAGHSYDALLYGIELGIDPDVFAYWNSTQADIRSARRFNFSEYKSKIADDALEAGRIINNPRLRAVRYRQFLDAWRKDAPAIALYQPRFLYLTRGELFNYDPKAISGGAGRFANVHNWMIREEKQLK